MVLLAVFDRIDVSRDDGNFSEPVEEDVVGECPRKLVATLERPNRLNRPCYTDYLVLPSPLTVTRSP